MTSGLWIRNTRLASHHPRVPINQTPEEIARDKIDRHLEASGWTIQSEKNIDLGAVYTR
jgi:type I site-specific restriction endonuclease